jgi:hypothetical protein
MIAAVVTGVAVAAQLAGVGPAHASVTPTITIAATTKFKPVTGDSFVIYHIKAYQSAKLHGTISNAAIGDVAALYAQVFPFKKPAVRVGTIKVKSAKTAYSFTVTPLLATHYAIWLYPSATSTDRLATSREQNLYVTTDQRANAPQKCSRPVCHETFHVDTWMPASALPVEMAKHMDGYFGISLGVVKIPAAPKWLYLNAAHATVSKPHRIAGGGFENTLTFTFTVGDHSYSFLPEFCTRDTEAKDGINLPGYHDCGASRVRSSQPYLG